MATGQRRIPGPAGALQEALRRGRDPDKIEAGDGAGPSGNPPPGSRTAGEAGLPGAIRPDEPYWQINLREHWAFKLGSWRRALDTIDVDQFEPTNPLLKTNCAWILEGGWKTTRCQRLCVAILNNSRSEFGDMNIVVGDPTGQIRCVVHKDVVQADSDAIRKGGSLLLKNVPVITFPECIEHMLVVTENELVQCFAPEEEPYLTKKHFDTAEELAAAVSRSMGMSEEDIEAGLAARASQGTPGREGPGASQGTPKSDRKADAAGVFEGKGAASEARTPTPAKAKASTAGWGRANVVVDNGTDDEDSDEEDAVLASQGPNSPEVVARRLHDQVLEARVRVVEALRGVLTGVALVAGDRRGPVGQRQAARRAGETLDSIDAVMAVGGGSALPWVQQWLQSRLPKTELLVKQPLQAVVLGALAMTPALQLACKTIP